eukprot:12424560-Karenia_brevis.AAC.1
MAVYRRIMFGVSCLFALRAGVQDTRRRSHRQPRPGQYELMILEALTAQAVANTLTETITLILTMILP